MDFQAFLDQIRGSKDYAGQIVYVRDVPAREAVFADTGAPLPSPVRRLLDARGIERLYTHQAEAVDLAREGRNVLVVTGTASGKTICYTVPIIESLLADPKARSLLLFPTKALCQDQFKAFNEALTAAEMPDVMAGVYDGDTSSSTRRKLRDNAGAIFSNPDMLHSALMPQHGRWAGFLSQLRILVLDELHVYSGLFGSNMANLLRRFRRLCAHYGSDPQVLMCSATVGNPKEMAEELIERKVSVVDGDGSPRGPRTYVFWNPPRTRRRTWRSRRSANVEAHELMAALIQNGVPTITFSKAKMTAEMIHRYVCETLQRSAPHLAKKVTPYRGGYRPEERREIEGRLFSGELMGVSCTRALELGIDVGALDAGILVGYPGTLASFFQQSGRAGRQERPSLVILVGLDTSINQYIMTHPEYLLDRPIEEAVLDVDNPYIVMGHLRCATHELPLPDAQAPMFGPYAPVVLRVLEDNTKVRRLGDEWYHAASETPQHEVSMRNRADKNVVIEDVDTGAVLGEVNKFDAPPILHPEAIYMHLGDTYRVLDLDLDKNIATVKRVQVDYYTQPLGGTDVHHVDHRLREKPFGTGMIYWGEVTAYFNNGAFEKIHFYSLDAISVHELDLPTFVLETMAFWIVPPEHLMERVRAAGLDAHSGSRAIGYATRMLLPAFITCDTLDFSHSIGSVNSEWNAIFVYERFTHGLGFTEHAYQRMHEILPAVLENIRNCPCEKGCPCCVGKPLRQYDTWDVQRGEGSIPSKPAAIMILEGMMEGGAGLDNPDAQALTDSDEAAQVRLERSLRRRLERMREPEVFHPIEPKVPTEYPEPEAVERMAEADVARRADSRRGFARDLRKRLAKKIDDGRLDPHAGGPERPPGMSKRGANAKPTDFAGRPAVEKEEGAPVGESSRESGREQDTIRQGDSLAAKARRLKKKRQDK